MSSCLLLDNGQYQPTKFCSILSRKYCKQQTLSTTSYEWVYNHIQTNIISSPLVNILNSIFNFKSNRSKSGDIDFITHSHIMLTPKANFPFQLYIQHSKKGVPCHKNDLPWLNFIRMFNNIGNMTTKTNSIFMQPCLSTVIFSWQQISTSLLQ